MNQPTPRTDPRVLRTRQLLRDAVIELLEEMDIEKISVNSIAQRAKINRVTFYLHYRDLPDMLDKMADDMVRDIRQVMTSSAETTETDEQENWPAFENLLQHIADHARFYKVILTSRQSTIFRDPLFRLIGEFISARLDNKENSHTVPYTTIPREIAVWYISSAMIGTIISWIRNDMPYSPLYLARQISLLQSQ
ncbi:TetR/AcrR family transcriptional regulator [Paenibacillus donghaensis]|uniref:TetR family transcriptional regulator n=1 Tax=Paenibacillus donghaensis TaxID=414771 RepID=A0A2Z2KJ51_9BACL|nr:TetR/AcrR family transcriptional regulator C-terminal domain-containing protein [Paenibacillus donghaensis]ASA23283.1 TetR family transcriptional regulator [Paenibacillus donghaensis]